MPILGADVELFPADLLERAASAERPWRVVQTKPRQEKALARELLAAAVPFYLPCDRRRVRVRNRVVTSHVPMFGGYVFAQSTDDERWRIAFTKRVARFLPVRDPDRLAGDLRGVRRILDLGEPVTPESGLARGSPVTVRSGPLAGMSGVVEKVATGFRFVVMVDFIGRGLSVTVDGAMLGAPGPAVG